MNIKRVSLKLDEEMHKTLKLISVEDDTTLQDMILEAIEDKYMTRMLEKRMKGEE